MALYATCMPLPSDTFHDKLIAYDHGDGADYDHDPRGGSVALYTTCVPLPSDTFHHNHHIITVGVETGVPQI